MGSARVYVERVAEILDVEYSEAEVFCKAVQALCSRAPSYRAIATALQAMEKPFTPERVKGLAEQAHAQELAKRLARASRPSKTISRGVRLKKTTLKRRRFREGPKGPPPKVATTAKVTSRFSGTEFVIDEYGTVWLASSSTLRGEEP